MFSIMLLLLWTIIFATTVLAQSEPPSCIGLPEGWFIDDPSDCSAYWLCRTPDSEAEPGRCIVGNFNEVDQTCDPDFPCDLDTTPSPTTEDTTTVESTTPEDPEDPEPTPPTNVCDGLPDGRFVNNPARCRSYFLCLNEIPLPRQCDMGLNFNEELQLCDRPTFTPCENEEFECPFFGISRWEEPGSCTDYNFCFGGEHRLQTCAEGLQFNTDISLCDLEESVACTRDKCPLDNNMDDIVTFPSENDCEQYYLCYNGNLELQFCAAGTHWNQDRQRCERPEDAQCELSTEPPTTEAPTDPPTTEPPTIDCPDEDGLSFLPNLNDCQYYFICVARQPFPQRCADGTLFDGIQMRCVVAAEASCPDGGERKMPFMYLISLLRLLWTIVIVTTVLAQSDPPNCADFPESSHIDNPDSCRAYWYCPNPGAEPEPNDCPEGQNFNPDSNMCDEFFDCEDPPTEPPTTEDPTDTTETDEPTDPPTDEPTTTTTPPDTTTQPTTTTTPRPPPPRNVCEGQLNNRLINNPTHCRSYFLCMNEVPLPRQCDVGFNFNEQFQTCDRPSLTPCSNDDFECPFYGVSRWEVLGSCTEYHFCFAGQHRLQTCADGLQFNTDLSICALEDSFDCTRDLCPIYNDIDDIVTYPADGYCDRYYICYDGNLELEFCAEGTHWNQATQRCERPEDAQCELDTTEPPTVEPPTTETPTVEPPTAEPPTTEPPSLIECPVGEGLFFLPHPDICQNYFICHEGTPFEERCSEGLLFDSVDLQCVIADRARCADGAGRSRQFTSRSAVLLHLLARAQ